MGGKPIWGMPRIQLMMTGMGREKGSAARKLPSIADDIRSPNGILNLQSVDRKIVWFSALSGLGFYARNVSIIKNLQQKMSAERHSCSCAILSPSKKGPWPTEGQMSTTSVCTSQVQRRTGRTKSALDRILRYPLGLTIRICA